MLNCDDVCDIVSESCSRWWSVAFVLKYLFKRINSVSLQVTKGMFGSRKKFVEFVEVVDNDFPDENMYYNQPSMFPHRSDKDVSFVPLSVHLLVLLEKETFSRWLTSCSQCFSSDALLTLAIIIGSAVAAWGKFVRFTKWVLHRDTFAVLRVVVEE